MRSRVPNTGIERDVRRSSFPAAVASSDSERGSRSDFIDADEPFARRDCYRFAAASRPKFHQHVRNVIPNGVRGYREVFGNLCVGTPQRKQLQHAALAGCEPPGRSGATSQFRQSAGQKRRGEPDLTPRCGEYRVEHLVKSLILCHEPCGTGLDRLEKGPVESRPREYDTPADVSRFIQLPDHFRARHVRQSKVDHGDVGFQLLNHLDPLPAAPGYPNHGNVVMIAQGGRQGFRHDEVIVDNHDFDQMDPHADRDTDRTPVSTTRTDPACISRDDTFLV